MVLGVVITTNRKKPVNCGQKRKPKQQNPLSENTTHFGVMIAKRQKKKRATEKSAEEERHEVNT